MTELPKIVIVGGGVAGLTAAHELKERGFRVTIYEREPECGGKARSFAVPSGYKCNDIVGLPAEHGFRFFPGFYRHLIDTLARIPAHKSVDTKAAGTKAAGAKAAGAKATSTKAGGAKTTSTKSAGRYVVDNLIRVHKGAIAQADTAFSVFPTKGPQTIVDGVRFFRDLLRNPSFGLGADEAAFAASKLALAMTTCEERRDAEMDDITWWQYMCADSMSDNYRRVVINGLTRNFVAMHAQETSLRTAITILARLLEDFISGRGIDRVLNGPTSEVWIAPWVEHLQSSADGQFPVSLCTGKRVHQFIFDEGTSKISGVQFAGGETVSDPEAIYIAAVPIEAMTQILQNGPPILLEHSPTLKLLCDRHLKVNWMSGILYYLKSDSPMTRGHVVYLDSGWALTSISQNQFWINKVISYGDGQVQGVLSAIISDWFKDGNGGVSTNTAFQAADADEVANEALAEIRAHIIAQSNIDISQENIVGYYLDPAIEFKEIRQNILGLTPAVEFGMRAAKLRGAEVKSKKGPFIVEHDLEPLFINTVGSWLYRPNATTDIENLFLAADYVRTNTDLATMEGANESGRRAVNRILDLLHAPGRRCRIFQFREPTMFAPMRALDRYCFKLGLPHPALLSGCP